uniref:2TM domain-containing protein n=1 Tax=Thaumasiovibrio occultus TaxID=1891184 RepID=UPI000B362A8C|nr:2TM domain-containing protein [Thaumasiovibrio occultus]
MIVRKLRLKRGWSQEQLSELAGLSVRTIQRIERGGNAGLESLNALAAVFEVDISLLQPEETMTTPKSNDSVLADDAKITEEAITPEEEQVIQRVKELKAFYSHVINYVAVMALLLVINLMVTPDYFWVVWPMLGWGIGLVSHGLSAFEVVNLFGPEWEKKQIEKRLGRKL